MISPALIHAVHRGQHHDVDGVFEFILVLIQIAAYIVLIGTFLWSVVEHAKRPARQQNPRCAELTEPYDRLMSGCDQ